ncbi:MAG: succinate dehydrogenase cytochrome b subunit [Sediminibacterium sp.]|nr:succinate dehydrogenase cytochrome b subunit [Sediminibacterium sp.]
MTWKQVFTSSVGKKLVMGLTGISLVLFLVVHAGINACIFADLVNPDENGEMFNKAAHFMGSTVLIRIVEVGLFAGILLHIAQGYLLTLENQKKRTVGYAVTYKDGSKWYSRSMGLLGTLILIFLILHLYHFWTSARFTGRGLVEVEYNGVKMHNMFALMQATFTEWWIVAVYALGCISLAYHLAHGFQSAFKTLGVHNKRYNTMLISLGYGYAIVIAVIFILMPVSFIMGWIG